MLLAGRVPIRGRAIRAGWQSGGGGEGGGSLVLYAVRASCEPQVDFREDIQRFEEAQDVGEETEEI